MALPMTADPSTNGIAAAKKTAKASERKAAAVLGDRTVTSVPVVNGVRRQSLSPIDVIAQWREEGPLERLSTGWPTFDEATRGGFPLGRFGLLLGAPNAHKTAAAAVLAWRWTHDGIAVGVHCVDEDAHDFVTRFAVMSGVTLDEAEKRAAPTLAHMKIALGELPLRLYGPDWTIEAAAADLDAWRKARGLERGAFFVDSLQTSTCDASLGSSSSLRTFVGANVAACAKVAARHRLAVIATGEIPRGHYDDGRNDMAATKESGAGEYAAKIQCVLRRAKRDEALVHVSVPKIKRGMKDEAKLALRFDRVRHTLTEESSSPTAIGADDAGKVEARILDVTRAAPAKGQELDTASKVARAAGGRYGRAFGVVKRLIKSGTLRLHDGSYRSGMEAQP